MPPHLIQRRPKKEDRKLAEGKDPKAKKLTPAEQEEADEKALEEACEKWCARMIRIVMVGSMLMGLLTPLYEFITRAPVIVKPTDLSGRTFVITGATDGVGTAAARRLAKDGARIIIGSRNMSRGEAAAAILRRETGNAAIEVRYLDLANLSSVADFAASLTSASSEDDEAGSGEPITGLLNNAGSLENACSPTLDGFETATQVNYLAPALLTHLLLPQLEQSVGARVVHVACPVTEKAKLTLEHLEPLPLVPDESAPACDVFQRYGTAKLMTLAFSSTLAKRLASRRGAVLGVFPVTTNAFDPVAVDTAFSETQPAAPSGRRRVGFMPQMLIRQALGWVLSPLLSPIGRRLGRLFLRSAETAGLGLVHMATAPQLARVSGKVFSLQSASALSREAGCTLDPEQCGLVAQTWPDPAALEKLWQETEAALAPWLRRAAASGAHGEGRGAGGGAGAAAGGGVPHTKQQRSEPPSTPEPAWPVEDDF
eukprot:jgi/Chrpa1/17624/Chrysochromulina_OHIO_Genome00009464-RA